MGQQLRRKVKRRRRLAYIDRVKAKVKEGAAGRASGARAKSKAKAPAASTE